MILGNQLIFFFTIIIIIYAREHINHFFFLTKYAGPTFPEKNQIIFLR